MRGYFSFIVAFACCILLVSLLGLQAAACRRDDSLAIATERAYSAMMDAKAAMLESCRQGALLGFGAYDAVHDAASCAHCDDHFCIPPAPGEPPLASTCDAALCSICFRESGARDAAESGALSSALSLQAHRFDPDFQIALGLPSVSARLAAEPLSKNGFRLASVSFTQDVPISIVSESYGVEGAGAIPAGTVVGYEWSGLG